MLKIAICDIEIQFRKRLQGLLANYMAKKGLPYEINEFDSGTDFTEQGIEMLKYQIIFLDVNKDGLQTAEIIRKACKEIFIVFTAASANYAVDGYKVNAIRYIVKSDIYLTGQVYECMDAITQKISCGCRVMVFDFTEGTRSILLDDLVYIESQLHKLRFYVMENVLNVYTVYGKLGDMELTFTDAGFVRIHQSYLVNMHYISEISRYQAELANGDVLKIPKKRYKHVLDKYTAYSGKNDKENFSGTLSFF